ncbi:MAG: response regulator transcription factor [Pseudomonadota bacterium]
MTIRVLVVDDQHLVRRGFAMVLGHEADIEVVAEASTGLEAIAAAREHQPDVILMDIRMPELDGLEATARILAQCDSAMRIIILTTFDPDEYIYKALHAGASGFILKDIPPEDLVAAVRTVVEGGAMLAPAITRRLIQRFAGTLGSESDYAQRLDRLTARERDVLLSLAGGKSNAEIADALFIGAATVKTHISNVLSKLGLRDRAQAVVFAYEAGLAKPGDQDIGF